VKKNINYILFLKKIINIFSEKDSFMSKQIFFAHSGGAQGSPGQGSYDLVEWLQESLDKEYEIRCPIIEDPEAPTYAMWKSMFNQELASLMGENLLIGHSLGGSMLLKFLSEEKTSLQIKGLFLVSVPFWGKDGWKVDDFSLRNNFQMHLPELPIIHLYHCLDDPIVPCEHMAYYKKEFPNAVVHELSGNDHAFTKGLPKIAKNIKNLERSAT
jgi:uncharacterized protein